MLCLRERCVKLVKCVKTLSDDEIYRHPYGPMSLDCKLLTEFLRQRHFFVFNGRYRHITCFYNTYTNEAIDSTTRS